MKLSLKTVFCSVMIVSAKKNFQRPDPCHHNTNYTNSENDSKLSQLRSPCLLVFLLFFFCHKNCNIDVSSPKKNKLFVAFTGFTMMT